MDKVKDVIAVGVLVTVVGGVIAIGCATYLTLVVANIVGR